MVPTLLILKANLDGAGNLFFDVGRQKSRHGVSDVVDRVVDNAVQADFCVFLLGEFARRSRRTHLESYDNRTRCRGQKHVGIGDTTHGLVNDIDLNFFGTQAL
jgi:hypothetical protein